MLLECLQPSDPLRVGLEEIRKVAERGDFTRRQLLTFSRKEKFVAVPIDLNTSWPRWKDAQTTDGSEIELVTRLDPNLHRSESIEPNGAGLDELGAQRARRHAPWRQGDY